MRRAINRVAKARGFDDLMRERAEQLIARHTEGRAVGFIGETRVNVLLLNLALDSLSANKSS